METIEYARMEVGWQDRRGRVRRRQDTIAGNAPESTVCDAITDARLPGLIRRVLSVLIDRPVGTR